MGANREGCLQCCHSGTCYPSPPVFGVGSRLLPPGVSGWETPHHTTSENRPPVSAMQGIQGGRGEREVTADAGPVIDCQPVFIMSSPDWFPLQSVQSCPFLAMGMGRVTVTPSQVLTVDKGQHVPSPRVPLLFTMGSQLLRAGHSWVKHPGGCMIFEKPVYSSFHGVWRESSKRRMRPAIVYLEKMMIGFFPHALI